MSHNEFAVPVLTAIFGLLDWIIDEIDSLIKSKKNSHHEG